MKTNNNPMVLFHSITFQSIEKTFWWVFVLLPFFTGLLAYHWLPNESFDKNRDVMISSHEVCHEPDGEQEECGEMADVWKNRQTGTIYSREQFAKHQNSERWRMLYARFGYGLLGCFFYGYSKWRDNKDRFFHAFGMTVCINIAANVFLFLVE